jgi:1-acyl-sn-glycerol-3-phosphate acyltransferase
MGNFLFFIAKLFGWKIDPKAPVGVDKAVIVVGPHTSNWDFIIGKIAFMKYGIPGKFLIKKELFFFPFGYLLKKMGGLPVDRSKNNRLTDYAVELFDKYEKFYLVFTPEGTRKYNPNWKKGFYYIAQKANVPIIPVAFNYGKKEVNFGKPFNITGDIDADLKVLLLHFKGVRGKIPENSYVV